MADGHWYGTTGVGPDLYVGAQEAVRAMVDHLAAEHGLSPEDAYLAARVINALVMSLAAIPSYFLARRFVTQRSALIAQARKEGYILPGEKPFALTR